MITRENCSCLSSSSRSVFSFRFRSFHLTLISLSNVFFPLRIISSRVLAASRSRTAIINWLSNACGNTSHSGNFLKIVQSQWRHLDPSREMDHGSFLSNTTTNPITDCILCKIVNASDFNKLYRHDTNVVQNSYW